MQETWDERYSGPEYIYGKNPNLWFKTFIDGHTPGKILLPGEGEGRNANYAAVHGWTVEATDQSANAREKALKLAAGSGVEISYTLGDLMEMKVPEASYDAIGLIFIHKTPDQRKLFYPKLIRGLKPGGFIVLEAFSKKQIHNTSGGPQDPELLFSAEELRHDFRDLEILELYELEQVLTEGLLHQGKADTIRMTAHKKG
jgi:2-polyprenyl-3-methyl-5-hydroxy-6-metoxy-1,4-benzoquinol methylase